MTTIKMIQRYSLRSIVKYEVKSIQEIKKEGNEDLSFRSWCKASFNALMHRKYTELLASQTRVGKESLYKLVP